MPGGAIAQSACKIRRMTPPPKPPRTPWKAFPDMLIHASEMAVKQHAAYRAANAGDDGAALVLDELRKKHGTELENWWLARFAHAFDALTESEARYLARTETADIVRNRVAAAE